MKIAAVVCMHIYVWGFHNGKWLQFAAAAQVFFLKLLSQWGSKIAQAMWCLGGL